MKRKKERQQSWAGGGNELDNNTRQELGAEGEQGEGKLQECPDRQPRG